MKKEKFSEALNHIDYSFIEEYVEEKERINRERQRRTFETHPTSMFTCLNTAAENIARRL